MPPRDGAWLIASKNRPDVGDVLTAIGVLPSDGTSAIARQCDGTSATAKLPGGGTAAIAR